ncbi:TorA maturation chaperone TorD [Symbiobacterium terraclitae]|uniref:TorA maturation chaperone TorD n=1 Tax=Symbiobacterium terraclitae TaxID=557451 RepID=A0ABS4JV77_9FIRM|nr:molecular chaperone TorD family protein [Symbiobacterium terraclitae]MBP2019435.1 TorA maturation chaperone TorD [Symbiobacterium terraclitae]
MATTAEARLGSEALTACLQARLFAYELLRKAFRQEPERGFALSLAHGGHIESFPYREESAEIEQGAVLVTGYLADSRNTSDAAYDELHWDYTRMFVGPYKLPAPPWESAYRTKERLLFQAETLAVRQAYLKYGLQAPGYPAEPDDHIGLELDFMHQTTRMALRHAECGEGEALVALLGDQLAFLEEHMLAWVPQFAADVVRSARTDFYRGMAQILNGFLAIDCALLQELLREPAAEA